MNRFTRISVYDLLKLGLIIVVAAFTYAIINPASRPEPIARASLPPYPQAAFDWKLDLNSRVLLNTQGVQLYALSEDGNQWQPVIPASLRLELPREFRLIQDRSGIWLILDGSGSEVAAWDAQSFQWQFDLAAAFATRTPTPTVMFSASPTIPSTPTPQVTPTRRLVLPATFTPTASPTPTLACPLRFASRVREGQTVKALVNLNVHLTPEMTENVIYSLLEDQIARVLAGPVCEQQGDDAYLWWEVNLGPGKLGWVVEASLNGAVFFLEPVE